MTSWRRGRGVARVVALACSVALAFTPRRARADVCPVPVGAEPIAAIDREERIAYLDRAFEREVDDVDEWSFAWGGVYAAGAVAQGVGIAYSHDHGNRIDLSVGTASAAFGAVSLTVLPLQLTLPLRAARRHLKDPDRCAALARAETTLFKVDKDQRFATGIVGHLGNVLVNVGIGLILGLGYDRWGPAALSMGVGIAVGEANAFTQPHHLRDVVERYRSGRFDRTSPRMPAGPGWAIVPLATGQVAGVTGAALRLWW